MATQRSSIFLKLSQHDVAAIDEWRQYDVTIKSLTREVESIQEKFTFAMAQTGARIATFRSIPLLEMRGYSRTGLDTQRLKREQPAIYAEYQTTHAGEKAKFLS